eukprot:scaffold249710_cov26-Tisochrysis_lutea.AAC.1
MFSPHNHHRRREVNFRRHIRSAEFTRTYEERSHPPSVAECGTMHEEHVSIDPDLMKAGDHAGSTFYELERFAQAALTPGAQPEVTLEDGAFAVMMGVGAQRSIEQGVPIYWKDLIHQVSAGRDPVTGRPLRADPLLIAPTACYSASSRPCEARTPPAARVQPVLGRPAYSCGPNLKGRPPDACTTALPNAVTYDLYGNLSMVRASKVHELIVYFKIAPPPHCHGGARLFAVGCDKSMLQFCGVLPQSSSGVMAMSFARAWSRRDRMRKAGVWLTNASQRQHSALVWPASLSYVDTITI